MLIIGQTVVRSKSKLKTTEFKTDIRDVNALNFHTVENNI
jgi:hypothetical protein